MFVYVCLKQVSLVNETLCLNGATYLIKVKKNKYKLFQKQHFANPRRHRKAFISYYNMCLVLSWHFKFNYLASSDYVFGFGFYFDVWH